MGRAYLVIAGETAVGKSEVALAVAERLGGEIVIADSRQVYRGLDIGTAKPGSDDRARVPHHLVDVVDVGTSYSAGDYERDAGAAIDAIHARGGTAVVCGGTGFYLAALAGGLDPLASVSDEASARAAEVPAERRREILAEVDARSAERIHSGDSQRIERALAFWFETGEPLSAWQKGGGAPRAHVAVRLVRDREEIRERIEARLDRMLAAGLEEEVRGFHARGFSPADPGLDGIGYQEWWSYFEGEIDHGEVRRRILAATRRYAKRQATWFRHQGAYAPVAGEGAPEEAARRVLELWRAAGAAARGNGPMTGAAR